MSARPPDNTAWPAVSVVVPTYNRADSLLRTLESVLAQSTSSHHLHEVIVVDNNSGDATRAAVEQLVATRTSVVRYLFEPKPGVSYARNAGIAAAGAPVIAFLDDDVRVGPDWIETICRVFHERPDVECLGGRVLPDWRDAPPRWLTRDHWAPLALLDFGDTDCSVNARNRLCLLTANLACRREVFRRAGLFRPQFQRVDDGIGSLEDHEWLLRFWAAGGQALYVPTLRAFTDVPPMRMTRNYHRRWHAGHGHFFALMREPEFERSSAGRFLDVPAHVYRGALASACTWIGVVVRRDFEGAFLAETRLRFYAGYIRTRWARYRSRSASRSMRSLFSKLGIDDRVGHVDGQC